MSERDRLCAALAVEWDLVAAADLARLCDDVSDEGDFARRLVACGHLTASQGERLDAAVSQRLAADTAGPADRFGSPIGDRETQTRVVPLGDGFEEPATRVGFIGASETPVAQVSDAADPRHPDVLRGRYRILSEHAQGGLGRVSLALDTELDREVALKEILPRYAGDPGTRERFVREAEVTGRLEHPGIVPVHGLTKEGVHPFYVMRFVHGQSLKDAIAAFHERSFAAAAERNLAFRELLGRFVDVCQAIDYAHSRGIIHRDLKPANVMLGDFGETLVVDWGLAKRIGQCEATTPEGAAGNASGDDGTETRFGEAIGTPAFMSPEQASGDPAAHGPATDVYALGGVLVAILTGSRPVAGTVATEIIDSVRDGDILVRRSCPEGIPRPLWAVCRKAMSRRMADRHAGAGELAEDVRRYLADEPVAAYREPPLARGRRWLRRHPAAAAALTASLLLGLLGAVAIALLVGGYSRRLADQKAHLADRKAVLADRNGQLQAALAAADGQRRRAERSLAAADGQRRRAETGFAIAREAVDTYCDRVVASRELEAHGLFGLRKELLQVAEPFYRRLTRQSPADPSARLGQAKAWLTLADLNRRTDDLDAAAADYRDALAKFAALHAEDPEDRVYRDGIADAEHNQALLLASRGDEDAAAAAYHRALKVRRSLVADFPGHAHYRRELALHLNNLGILMLGRDRFDDAEDSFLRSLELRQRLAADFPDHDRFRSDLADAYHNLSILYGRRGAPADAERAYRQALELLDGLMSAASGNPEHRSKLVANHASLAILLADRGDRVGAEEAYRHALRPAERLAEEFPQVPKYRLDAIRIRVHHAELTAADRPRQAVRDLTRAEAALKETLARTPRRAAARRLLEKAYCERAKAYERLDQFAAAALDWERAGRLDPDDADSRRASAAWAWSHVHPELALATARQLLSRRNMPAFVGYRLARTFARCVPQDDGTWRTDLARQAGNLLDALHAHGYFSDPRQAEALHTEGDLDALRRRADFRKLLRRTQPQA